MIEWSKKVFEICSTLWNSVFYVFYIFDNSFTLDWISHCSDRLELEIKSLTVDLIIIYKKKLNICTQLLDYTVYCNSWVR